MLTYERLLVFQMEKPGAIYSDEEDPLDGDVGEEEEEEAEEEGDLERFSDDDMCDVPAEAAALSEERSSDGAQKEQQQQFSMEELTASLSRLGRNGLGDEGRDGHTAGEGEEIDDYEPDAYDYGYK